jgi:membrane-associated phospholipid phosphatase
MDLRPIGWPARAWLIFNGVFYLQGVILLVAAVHPPSPAGTPGVFSRVMAHSSGRMAVLVVGLVMVGVGTVLTYRAIWRPGTRYRSTAPASLQPAIQRLGRIGRIGRGFATVALGVLFALDVWTWTPAKADAADEALRRFWQQPYGRPILVALGLMVIAFALYELAEAKYRRIASPDPTIPARRPLGGRVMPLASPSRLLHPRWSSRVSAGQRAAIRLIVGMVALWGVLIGLGSLLVYVWTPSQLTDWDARVSQWFLAHRTPTWTALSTWGSYLAETVTCIAVTAIAILVLRWWLGRWRESIVVVVAIVGELMIFLGVTTMVHRHRPAVPRLDPSVLTSTSSFPSGHTGAAVALYCCLGVIVLRNVRRRWLAVSLAAVLFTVPVIVGVSRVYRGMHNPTDVIAAAAAMACWLALVLAVLLRHRSAQVMPEATSPAVMAAL